MAFGALLEWPQSGIPGRTGSLRDILLNAADAGAGAALILTLAKWNGRKEKGADTRRDAQGVSWSSPGSKYREKGEAVDSQTNRESQP